MQLLDKPSIASKSYIQNDDIFERLEAERKRVIARPYEGGHAESYTFHAPLTLAPLTRCDGWVSVTYADDRSYWADEDYQDDRYDLVHEKVIVVEKSMSFFFEGPMPVVPFDYEDYNEAP